MDIHSANKNIIARLRQALYDYVPDTVQRTLCETFTADATVYLAYPFETLAGPEELYQQAYRPLQQAIPDLERRDTIVMAGATRHGDNWVGCCGEYTGSFESSWLDIPMASA